MLGNTDKGPSPQVLSAVNSLRTTFPYLLWSLADEPGLHPESDARLNRFRQVLDQQQPSLKTLAQLNRPGHESQALSFDTVLINQGYGLTQERITRLQASGVEVFLYNLPHLRFAAGLYLWRSGAAGFWQWHGRMPTAHPFDPTDGREDDVQFLLPAAGVCQPAELHASLLAIRQGINDHRWLTWLMQNANQDIHSALLVQELRQKIAADWDANFRKKTFENKTLSDSVVAQIKQLAWAMQSPR